MSLQLLDQFHNHAVQSGLEYLIIGGFAASYWGTPRFTADIDFAIPKNQLPKAIEVTTKLGYKLLFTHPKEAFAHFGSATSEQDRFRIDLMLVDHTTWTKLKSHAVLAELGGTQPYPMVGVLHFIAMKLHAAKQPDRTEFDKDILDVRRAMLKNKISYEDLENAGITERHGSEKTLRLLRSLLGSAGPE